MGTSSHLGLEEIKHHDKEGQGSPDSNIESFLSVSTLTFTLTALYQIGNITAPTQVVGLSNFQEYAFFYLLISFFQIQRG